MYNDHKIIAKCIYIYIKNQNIIYYQYYIINILILFYKDFINMRKVLLCNSDKIGVSFDVISKSKLLLSLTSDPLVFVSGLRTSLNRRNWQRSETERSLEAVLQGGPRLHRLPARSPYRVITTS